MSANEKTYDEKIFPLMQQVIEICKEAGIGIAATFEYDPGDFCTTVMPLAASSESFKALCKQHHRLLPPSPLQITTTKADGSKIIEVVIA